MERVKNSRGTVDIGQDRDRPPARVSTIAEPAKILTLFDEEVAEVARGERGKRAHPRAPETPPF